MFRILTCLSAPYADALRVFMPSWVKNSGAAEIRVRLLDPPPATHREYMLRRWDVLTRELGLALEEGRPLVWLDADCFVLRELSPIFDGSMAMAVARWPTPNIGVMAFDTRTPFHFYSWAVRTGREIGELLASSSEIGACDQWAVEKALHAVSSHVRKLDWRVWNFCDSRDGDSWPRDLAAVRDRVRIAHVKGLGDWQGEFCQKRIAAVKALFPGRV